MGEEPTSWRILAVYGKCEDSAMIPSVTIGDGADGAPNYQVRPLIHQKITFSRLDGFGSLRGSTAGMDSVATSILPSHTPSHPCIVFVVASVPTTHLNVRRTECA